MKLRTRLFLGIALVLAITLAGGLFAMVRSTQSYLESQLASHAQDAATVLSVGLADPLAADDRVRAELQVLSLFDRGFYQNITVLDLDQHVLIHKALAPAGLGVPDWFVQLVPLHPAGGEALISAGWKQLGRVVVESTPQAAYQHAWRDALTLSGGALAGALVLALLIHLFLGRMLRTLGALEDSATLALQNRYEPLAEQPGAPTDVQQLVRAFNAMIAHIRHSLAEAAEHMEVLRRTAFEDPVTGLSNRAGFEHELSRLLEGDSFPAGGWLVVVELDALNVLNARLGYLRVSDHLHALAERSLHILGYRIRLSGKLSGGLLAFVLGGSDPVDVPLQILQQVLGDSPIAAETTLRLCAVPFAPGDQRSQLFTRMNAALRAAGEPGSQGFRIVPAVPGDATWQAPAFRTALEQAIADGKLMLAAQAVVDPTSGAVLHREVLARLPGSDGDTLPAATFLPMARHFGLLATLDLHVLERVLRWLASRPHEHLAVNLSHQTLGTTGTLQAVEQLLRRAGAPVAARLTVELNATDCQQARLDLVPIVNTLRGAGVEVGFDHVGLPPGVDHLLRDCPPSYVKIAAEALVDARNPQLMEELREAFLKLAASLNVLVIAQSVETAEQGMVLVGLAGVQGRAIAPPMPLEGA